MYVDCTVRNKTIIGLKYLTCEYQVSNNGVRNKTIIGLKLSICPMNMMFNLLEIRL